MKNLQAFIFIFENQRLTILLKNLTNTFEIGHILSSRHGNPYVWVKSLLYHFGHDNELLLISETIFLAFECVVKRAAEGLSDFPVHSHPSASSKSKPSISGKPLTSETEGTLREEKFSGEIIGKKKQEKEGDFDEDG